MIFAGVGLVEGELEARLARLRAWYSVLGAEPSWIGSAACFAGVVSSGKPCRDNEVLTWGEFAAPSSLELVTASDAVLRRQFGGGAAIARTADTMRIVTGPAGPLALYEARLPDGAVVWSSHTVAAALLAGLALELDIDAIPQLLSIGHISDERSQVRGVVPVGPATVIDVRRGAARARCYWEPAERWHPVAPEEAAKVAACELLTTLSARLHRVSEPILGLTGGLDSRVVAVALEELGVNFRSFTWGSGASADAASAARIAAELGVPHSRIPEQADGPEGSRVRAIREAPWYEGLGNYPIYARPDWPKGADAFLTGGGGETGRAYYYRLLAANYAKPSIRQIRRLWRPERLLQGATTEALEGVQRACDRALERASLSGHHGWALLDVVYGMDRLVRWGRSMYPHSDLPMLACLGATQVQRALASLPLDDRLTDAFHRGFVGRRLECPPPPGSQRRGIPRALRRIAARVRRSRSAYMSGEVGDAPGALAALNEWITTDVLERPAFENALGHAWLARERQRVITSGPTETVLQLAQLAALEDAWAALRPAPG